jgi:hypothetical protein
LYRYYFEAVEAKIIGAADAAAVSPSLVTASGAIKYEQRQMHLHGDVTAPHGDEGSVRGGQAAAAAAAADVRTSVPAGAKCAVGFVQVRCSSLPHSWKAPGFNP